MSVVSNDLLKLTNELKSTDKQNCSASGALDCRPILPSLGLGLGLN